MLLFHKTGIYVCISNGGEGIYKACRENVSKQILIDGPTENVSKLIIIEVESSLNLETLQLESSKIPEDKFSVSRHGGNSSRRRLVSREVAQL